MDDGALWEAFSTSRLAGNRWTHEAHVRTAWLFLQRHPVLDEAHLLMRIGIVRLNASHGLVETPVRGYHETLTRVWLVLVASKRATLVADDSAAFFAAAGRSLGKEAALQYYSHERLMSTHARATFVEPDLHPLPLIETRSDSE